MSLLRGLFGRRAAASEPPSGPGGEEWRSRGNAALSSGDLAEAGRCYAEAARADVRDPLARLNLGFVLLEQARLEDAQANLVQALALQRPGDDFAHDAHYLLARIHQQRGAGEQALAQLEAALAVRPDFAEARRDRASIALERGKPALALEDAKQLAAIHPGAEAPVLAARALNALGRFEEARDSADAALRVHAELPPALLAKVEALRGLLPLSRSPANVLVDLASALRELRELPEALRHADEAIAIAPGLAGGHLERAKLLGQLGRDEEAVAACRRACELDPSCDAFEVLAALYARLRLADEALEACTRAVQAHPADLPARSRELFFANFSEATRVQDLFERHREYGRLLEERVPATYAGRWAGSRDPERRLRIGFVSPDLCRHPVVLFLMPLLANIDRSRFHVSCYSTGRVADETTAQIRSMVEGWVPAAGLDDAQLAAKAHEDGIDVLIDLAGHTGTPLLAAFAQRPAPVQMTWLGYLNTTGLTRIDYRLCDERTDPAETQRFNTERLLPLPASQWCYRPFVDAEPSRVAPCTVNGYVTFGSFNNARKISDAMCDRWAQLLARCAGSRLLIADVASAEKERRLRAAFGRHDVAADRLELVPRAEVADYLRLYDRVDISLDPYPYGGGTTTIDSLWMGVPVVTARGELPVSRSASSILELLGLQSWVAPSIEGYVDCAVRAAADPAAIQLLRTSLRTTVSRSPLRDEAGFARAFENALRSAWRRHCAEAG